MNDPLDRIWDRYMEEAGNDLSVAFRLLSADYLYACSHVSNGFARVGPVARSGLSPKAQVEAIDIPSAESPVAANPGS